MRKLIIHCRIHVLIVVFLFTSLFEAVSQNSNRTDFALAASSSLGRINSRTSQSAKTKKKVTSNLRLQKIYGKVNGKDFDWGYPKKIVASENGRIYVLDVGRNHVMVYDNKMRYLLDIGRGTTDNERFVQPTNVAVSRGKVYVLDGPIHAVKVFSEDGRFIRKIELPRMTFSFAVDKRGNIYSSDFKDSKPFVKLDSTGKILKNFGKLIEANPRKVAKNMAAICYEPNKDVVVVSYTFAPLAQVYSTEGELIREFAITSKIVDELKDYVALQEIGDIVKLTFISFDAMVTREGLCIVLAHGTDTKYSSLYRSTLDGRKIDELPILDALGSPVTLAQSVCMDAAGQYVVTSQDKRLLVYRLKNKNH